MVGQNYYVASDSQETATAKHLAALNENIGRLSAGQVAGGDLATAWRGVLQNGDGEMEPPRRVSGRAVLVI
jgi:hypothetical protein